MQKNFIRNTICMTAIVMSMVMTAACGTSTDSSEGSSSAPSVQSVANLPAAVTETKAVVVSIPAAPTSNAATSTYAVAKTATLPAASTKAYAENTSAATKAVEAATQAVTETSTEAATETADTTEEAVEDISDNTSTDYEEVNEDTAVADSSDDNSVVEDAGEAQVNEEPVNDSIGQSGHYVLNTSTKKFHYAGCASAKQIKASNYAEFDGDRDTLISRGYSACKKCNP